MAPPTPVRVETRKTTCNRDCPDVCSIVATIEDGRVVRLAGDPDHPVTRGFLCWRTNHFLPVQYAPERLTTPLLRGADGVHRPISWDAALELAAERLGAIRRESGPAAIFHYRSGGSLGMLKMLSDWFFELFGPVTIKRGDICSGAGEAAQETDFGACDSHDLFDLVNARNILLWGKNVFVSSPHAIPVLNDARARGARIALVDPVHHRTAELCEQYWQPRPGGDFALAMAVARVLLARGVVASHSEAEGGIRCDNLPEFTALAESRAVEAWCADADVPVAAAEDLAARLSDGPTAILVGWGMGRRGNGGAIVRALDALAALSGNLGVRGGGVSFYFRRRGAFDTSFIRGQAVAPRTICEPLFGRDLLEARDPPVRAVWITAGNPVAMLPESETTAEALRTREFVVVVDSFLTDTARLAHLVLPTTTLLEADDLVGSYGHHHLGVARPVVAPPDGVRSDLEIIQALATRVGLGDALAGTAREWKSRLISGAAAARGVSVEAMEAGVVKNPLAAEVLFSDGRVPTPTGRVNLLTEAPREAVRPPEFPLALLSLSTDRAQSSQWSARLDGPAVCTVHPDVAAAAGLADGALGRLQSTIGELQVRIRCDARQRRDVALVPKGGHLRDGRAANALIRARTTDLGEGGALYDEGVRLRG
jgi:anaerobic selenocysteine-containing dehydrogenase